MVGILVQGDNHFIVRGPLPNRKVALELIRHWSSSKLERLRRLRSINGKSSPRVPGEPRMAVVVPGDDEMSPAVTSCWTSCRRELPYAILAGNPGRTSEDSEPSQ